MDTNNNLIAEYMGLIPKYNSYSKTYGYSDPPFYYMSENTYEKATESLSTYVKYRTSWDWIMPVVRAIGIEYGHIIDRTTGKTMVEIIDQSLMTHNIAKVYDAVICVLNKNIPETNK